LSVPPACRFAAGGPVLGERFRHRSLQAALLDHLLADPLGGVAGAYMSDLVAEHSHER
jgi:hypothetical protein